MRPDRTARAVVTLVLLVVGALGATACRKAQGRPPIGKGSKSLADSADQIIFGQRTLITDRGLSRAEILADTSFFFDENTRIEMRKVNGTFFNSSGMKDALLTSREGLYNSRYGVLEARGDVVITSLDGRRLASPMVHFDQRINQLLSDSVFVLTEPNGREIRGIGFKSDPDMTNIKIDRVLSAKGGAVSVPDR
jgi:hypothetical protein